LKRSQQITLAVISSFALVACAEDQYRTNRAMYNSREECERDWGVGDQRCVRNTYGTYYGPHFLFLGGRSYFYPYQNGQPSNQPVAAPSSARFVGETFVGSSGRAVVGSTGISRGGFGSRGFGGG
jgi:uncharacterized protein YgiB involved in biofilm formation